MFGFRRISFRSSPCCPSSLITPILGLHYNVADVSGYHALPYMNHGYLRQLLVSSYSSYSVETLKVAKGKHSQFASSFSTLAEPILVQAHDPSRLALDLVNAVDEHRFEDAWKLCERHMLMYGFLRKSTLTKLISGSAESCQSQWLAKAYDLVELIFNEKKHELLEKESLIYLSFMLARCESPILASNVLRKLIQMEAFPPLSAWSGIIGHMSQTATGAFLAAELIMEIGYLFNDNRVDPRKKSNRPLIVMKPNSNVFNIALTGCLLFGTTRKAERLLDLMPRIGVKADANLLIIMAHVYEKNGRKDEIKKLKRHIEEACGLTSSQFQQFYNCLLSCHLKFGDLASAAEIVLSMLRKAKEAKMSLSAAKSVVAAVDTRKTTVTGVNYELKKLDVIEKFILAKSQAPSYNEFLRDRKYSRLEKEAQECLHLLTDMLQGQVELVKMENGILHPTDKIYAKLVRAFLEADKVSDLAVFLITASKEDSPSSIESSAVVQVINACISLGMLDQAHDLLDEMKFSGVRLGSSIYSSLLKAYCKENRQGDAMALLRDARKAGVQLDSSCYETLIESRIHHKDSSGALHLFKEMKESNIPRSGNHGFEMLVEGCSGSGEANLMAKLLEEKKDNQSMDYGVHDWNNIIHFFCKKRLMHDAQRALNKMRALGHSPNAVTFHSLVTGYAAIGGKYMEVTDLWGEMKVLASSNSMKFDQELLDSLLYCFVRGGFFLRAIEVIEMMEKGNMFIDKYKYRSLWLKYHRTLYKGKAPKVQTEAQCKRREAALTFKKWIGFT